MYTHTHTHTQNQNGYKLVKQLNRIAKCTSEFSNNNKKPLRSVITVPTS
jgi:hypothetical protein